MRYFIRGEKIFRKIIIRLEFKIYQGESIRGKARESHASDS